MPKSRPIGARASGKDDGRKGPEEEARAGNRVRV